jgi:hypothetical protein
MDINEAKRILHIKLLLMTRLEHQVCTKLKCLVLNLRFASFRNILEDTVFVPLRGLNNVVSLKHVKWFHHS